MGLFLLAKKALVDISSKPIPQLSTPLNRAQYITTFSKYCFSSSSRSERPEGGNVSAEGGDMVAGTTAAVKETAEEGRFKAKGGLQDIANDTTGGMADYMADVSRDKAIKSADATAIVGDPAEDMPHLKTANHNDNDYDNKANATSFVGQGH